MGIKEKMGRRGRERRGTSKEEEGRENKSGEERRGKETRKGELTVKKGRIMINKERK